MLNAQTYAVISSLKDISDDMIFTYPMMGISDSNKTIMAYLDIKGLGNEDFQEFGIMGVKQYLYLLNIAGKDVDVTNKEGVLHISSTSIKCKYSTTNIGILEAKNCRAPLTLPDNFNSAIKAIEFYISSDDVDKIKKVSSLLKFEDVVITSENGKVVLKVDNETQKSSNDFKIYLDGECEDSELAIVLSVSNIKKLPQGNYVIRASKNPKNPSSVLVRFESQNVEGLNFYVATKAIQK